MKRLILFSVLMCGSTLMRAQQQMPLYTQYIFNPYLINPAYVAYSGRSEINLLYRQQWAGVEDGPKTLNGDIQLPLSERISVGANFCEDKTVLLSNTSVMLTFGYKVQLTSNQMLGFGMSGGVISNHIRMDENTNTNDPALMNTSLNNTGFNAQFGIQYSVKNFSIGFAMLQLIENDAFSADKFQSVKFSELENTVLLASYRLLLGEKVSLFPNVAYRFTTNDFNYYEGSLLLSYNNVLHIGGGYRQNIGPNVIARIKIGDLQIGYAFDFPTAYGQVSPGGTNEIQAKWMFGKSTGKDQSYLYKNYNSWWRKHKSMQTKYRRQMR